jgi:branched-chain amino acid transport system ATP-binding protein/urea transport system ATP-binding protein
MSGALLQAENLSVRFGGVVAVDGVSLAVETTGLTCIIGPNGAGKSTLFNMLTGTVRPSAGRILLRGADITGRPVESFARHGIARKFQTPSVFESLSVAANIDIAQRRRGATAGKHPAREILALLSLAADADRPASVLAHGQKQWLEIGMALAAEPSLMLLDEPTAGMGPEETQKTAHLLRELSRETAIAVIEHDMAFVRTLACQTFVMHQGKIIASGAFTAIEDDPLVRDVYLGRR